MRRTTRSYGSGARSAFPESEISELRRRWDNIQAGFVDEPRKAVQEADKLVASTVQRYRSFFSRLLSL